VKTGESKENKLMKKQRNKLKINKETDTKNGEIKNGKARNRVNNLNLRIFIRGRRL
jgi:hypothetical protein